MTRVELKIACANDHSCVASQADSVCDTGLSNGKYHDRLMGRHLVLQIVVALIVLQSIIAILHFLLANDHRSFAMTRPDTNK